MLHHCLKPLFWVCKDQLWLDEQKSYFMVNLQSAEDFKSSKILIVPHVTTAKREKNPLYWLWFPMIWLFCALKALHELFENVYVLNVRLR